MARKKSTSSKSKSTRGGTSSRRKTSSRSKSKSKTSKEPLIQLNHPQRILLAGIGLIFITAVIVLSLMMPDQGQFTRWLADAIWQLFGWGGIMVPVVTGSIGAYLVLMGMEQHPQLPIFRLIGAAALFVVFAGFASMLALMADPTLGSVWDVAQAGIGGGYFGGAIAAVLSGLVGTVGAVFILIMVGIIGALLVTGVTRQDLAQAVNAVKVWWQKRSEPQTITAADRDIPINPGRSPRPSAATSEPAKSAQLPLPDPADAQKAQVASAEKPKSRRRTRKKEPAPKPSGEQPTVVISTTPQGNESTQIWNLPTVASILEPGSDQETNDATIREQVEVIEQTLESFGAPATVVEINQGPTITQFGVEPSYLEMRNGKRTKVKVGKIAGLADDLALALAARSIRIQAPVPGKGYVGIEVPNVAKAMVSLRDVIESPEFGRIKTPLGVGLGQNVAGQPIVADLASMPHVLVAGTTGSGKSVCVNGIIACLLLQNTPADLKLVMIDPKRVELTGYNGIPHLAAPVIVDMDRVISTLQWALREMDTRYKLFAEVGARNIIGYNKKMAQKKGDKMPYIVIIIDELADLMMMAPEDTERAITRLAQMARATGMHMVIATQRPSVDVVTGLIKANFPARIAFAVASSTDSRVILDSTGAERLLGQGDMLFQSPDAGSPMRCQGCFVSDAELTKLISYWQRARRQNVFSEKDAVPRAEVKTPPAKPTGAKPPSSATPARKKPVVLDQTPEPEPAARQQKHVAPTPAAEEPTVPPKPTSNGNSGKNSAESGIQQQPLWEALQEEAEKPDHVDELMPEAIALVRKLNKASTSLLQRRFRIGYTRAARMIDAMEEMGIIGPPTGTSKAREVLPVAEDGEGETDGISAESETPPENEDTPA